MIGGKGAGRRALIEYVMLAGVNDTEECGRQLGKLLQVDGDDDDRFSSPRCCCKMRTDFRLGRYLIPRYKALKYPMASPSYLRPRSMVLVIFLPCCRLYQRPHYSFLGAGPQCRGKSHTLQPYLRTWVGGISRADRGCVTDLQEDSARPWITSHNKTVREKVLNGTSTHGFVPSSHGEHCPSLSIEIDRLACCLTLDEIAPSV